MYEIPSRSVDARPSCDELRDMLTKFSITEQRGFLKSFVERIEVGDSEVKMYYTIPMPLHDSQRDSRSYIFRTPRVKEGGIKGVR